MISFFLNVAERSISAAWMILAVLILRLLLKGIPKWGTVALWGMVTLRLLLPFSIESPFSPFPSVLPKASLSALSETSAQEAAAGSGYSLSFFSIVWIIGMLILLGYLMIRYFLLRRKLRTAILLRGNVWQTEMVRTPMVVGFFRPRIYIPFCLTPESIPHILTHERTHIRRGDHWWKLLGFLSLAIHWFNPLVWVAYRFLCRDIEIACDEAVIRELDHEGRANYTQALVSCGRTSSVFSCQLGFGQMDIKKRAKAILRYRKPARFGPGFLILPCLLLSLCFLTASPASAETSAPSGNISVDAVVPVTVPEDDVLLEQMKQDLENQKNEQAIRLMVQNEEGRTDVTSLNGRIVLRLRPHHQEDCPHCHPQD